MFQYDLRIFKLTLEGSCELIARVKDDSAWSFRKRSPHHVERDTSCDAVASCLAESSESGMLSRWSFVVGLVPCSYCVASNGWNV